MKVTLHMAVSVDGYIAREDGDTDWVSKFDLSLFEKRCKEAGCVVMGRTTFEEVGSMENVTTIVLSHKSHEQSGSVVFARSPREAVSAAEKSGHKQILLAGGGSVNGAFLSADLLDEIYLSVHPIILGKGIWLFGDYTEESKLELIDTEVLPEGLAQLHYKVL